MEDLDRCLNILSDILSVYGIGAGVKRPVRTLLAGSSQGVQSSANNEIVESFLPIGDNDVTMSDCASIHRGAWPQGANDG
jgi:hypothetical protein